MSSFRTVAAQHNYPEKEEEVLAFWKKIDAFQRSMQISEEEGRPEFTFYDGPPFATGLPHYGHILAGTIKDVVTRFAYQTGFHVSRRFGWDTHGLPVEHEIDKKLNITSKQDVMDMGIAAYNKECRSIVTRYCAEWEEIVTRLGRWIDFKNDYKTLEPWYMESVWWVFKTISDKDLVYRGYRVMPYSTGCTTPLSNFEANLNYKEVSDPAVVVSFPLVEDPETSFLAWTTTPWTLPSNLALCVHPESKYVKVKDNATGRQYILMEKRLVQVYPKMAKKGYKNDEFVVLETYTGADLKGMRYEPLFPYFKDHPNAFQVLNDTYVTEDGGTGVVHQAPAFGEDDNRVCEEHGVLVKGGPLPCPIDENGCFDDTVPDYIGLYVKDADNKICAKLKENGRLISKGSIKHSYPFCWRSETPLIYKIVPSWFVSVTTIKERLVANNLETYWVPQNVREKRFHNWLVNARDWNVSRNRYWGTPIPVWISDDGEERVVVGSIQELEELSGQKVTDLHRESIDHITIPSKEGRGDLKRIEEVFDCWFESGSMPYAQQHYPFENKEKFQEKFPADFIAEGLDQTRGWFYTLMVLSTALFDRPAFKNLIVNGLVLAEDGKKMSKSKKNYPDPMLVINEYGSDAIRLYLINSPVVRAEPLKFRKGGVADVRKNVFNPWYNSYRFFVQNAQRLELDTGAVFETSKAEQLAKKSENVMDRWIMASLHRLIEFVRGEMSAYRLYTVVPELLRFGEQLTNWYVRLNRQRLKGVAPGQTNEDVHVALSTLYVVLLNLTKLMSPITPFFTEFMYQELVQPDENSKQASVHFCQLPEFDPEQIDKDIEKTMSFLQTTITLGRLCRERRGTLSMKQPVSSITVVVRDAEVVEKLKALERYIKAELNTRNITWSTDQEKWCTLEVKLLMQVNFKKLDISDEAKDQWQEKCKELGSRLGRDVGKVMKGMSALTAQEILDFETTGSVTVAGHTLTMDDVEFVRKARKGLGDHLEMDSSDGVTLVLDTNLDESLVQEGLVREVLNRIQKLRKSAELEFQDKVEFFFDVVPEIERDAFNPIEQLKGDKATQHVNELVAAIKGGDQMINETLRGGTLFPISRCPEFAVRVADARDVVHGVTLRLVLTRPSVSFPATAKLASDLGVDEATVQAVKTTVGFTSYATIVQHVTEQKSLKVSLGGNFSGSYELVPNKHFFAEVPKEE